MSSLRVFNHHFALALWHIRTILLGLLAWLVVDAVAIAYFEQMPIADALYFTFVTGFTIGYGDIAPVTAGGRVVSLLAGLAGLIFTGLIAAVAVYALRAAMPKPPPDSVP